MMEKYKSEVLKSYEQKKAMGELSSNLVHFTPANLRNEARLQFGAGCDPLDRRTLKEFFGMPFENEISDLVIKKCDPEKFKPLCNYLKKGIKTREKNIELLAWLIDFHPRPFSNYWRRANGKDGLSLLTISQRGVVEERSRASMAEPQNGLYAMGKQHKNKGNRIANPNISDSDETEILEAIEVPPHTQMEVILEYPSGVKLKVDAGNIPLIAQLVRL